MPAEQKQLIRASQIAAHKTPSAPESPLLLCYVTDRERRGGVGLRMRTKLEHLLFFPCGKLYSTWVLKIIMADLNFSNNFDTLCIIDKMLLLLKLYFSWLTSPPPLVSQGLLTVQVLLSHSDTPHVVALLLTSDQPDQRPLPENTQHSQEANILSNPKIPASERPQTNA
jgi:hypothetical protein